ncbi:MAG: hypothetical protein KAU28_09655 [Phycisphaerae bacterium]|nr:hypothetical protein [Phycisphaerae bacterium]
MRKLLIVLVVMVSGLVGCSPDQRDRSAGLSASGSEGLVDSTDQRSRRIGYIEIVNSRMLTDDWDRLWLNERSTRLTSHIIYIGH